MSPRTDASPRGRSAARKRGKPCGKSFISASFHCGKQSKTKQRLKTAAKVALAAGITAGSVYAIRRLRKTPSPMEAYSHQRRYRPGERDTLSSTPISGGEHYYNNLGKVKAHSAGEMANLMSAMEADPKTNTTTVREFAKYIRKNNVRMDSQAIENLTDNLDKVVKDALNAKGKPIDPLTVAKVKVQLIQEFMETVEMGEVAGTYWSGQDSNIWVRRMGYPGKINPNVMKEVTSSVDKTLNVFAEREKIAREMMATSDRGRLNELNDKIYSSDRLNTPNNMGNSKNPTANDVLTYIHEVGHSVHHKVKWDTTTPFTYRGNKIDPQTDSRFRNEYLGGLTRYGRTNVAEGFAEYFVSYITAGPRLERERPLVYRYIDDRFNRAMRVR